MADKRDFQDTPSDWARYWTVEFGAAKEWLKDWWDTGDTIVKRFLDERDTSGNELFGKTRINVFTSNIQTQEAILFGKTPTVSVTRRFGDSNDDQARVASEMLERLLNTDIDRDDDNYATAVEQALSDRLLPGLGNVWLRYEVETETEDVSPQTHPETGAELAPGFQREKRTREDVVTDYVYWKDQLWSPARNYHDVRWWARKVTMGRDQIREKFGKVHADAVPMNAPTLKDATDDQDSERATPWDKADVWEIWSKEHRRVFHFVEGYSEILAKNDDPTELEGFWPFPRPMMANLTTSAFRPRPDFSLAKDLYDEIDTVSTRITLLERAIRAAGVYDKTQGDLQRLLEEDHKNELIPCDNWTVFAQKGGINGSVAWFPIDMIVNALTALRDYRKELMQLLYEVTGMSDIVRGAGDPNETATAQAIKSRFASVRMQRMQNDVARFASEVQKIKAEIISRWFDPQTIIERSNVMYTNDAPLAQAAVQLIKSRFADYRVEVKPEAVALDDFTRMHQEGSEVIGSLGQFFQAMVPVVQMLGPAGPGFMLQLGQWFMTRLKGAGQVESLFDQAVAQQKAAQQQAAMHPPPPPPPDPKVIAQQIKSKTELAKPQVELHADLARINAETQADITKQAAQAHFSNATAEAQQRREALNAVNGLLDGGR